jgi:flagellum-specific peptidoglycan hydrolase FlgJ
MPGVLLTDDAIDARRQDFQNWVDEQKQKGQQALQSVTQPVQQAVDTSEDAINQRRQDFINWTQQQPQPTITPVTAPTPAPTPAPAPLVQPPPELQTPEPDDVTQRRNDFLSWTQQITNPTLPSIGAQAEGGTAAAAPTTTTTTDTDPGSGAAVNTPDQGQQAVAARTAAAVEPQRQFETEAGLSTADAYTACGPVAAAAFAQTYGRNPTPSEAVALAREVGWNPGTGMAGPQSEVALLQKLGVDAHVDYNVDWSAVQSSAQGGNPVILSTPNHYLYVDGYNPQTGEYHVGASGSALAGGSEWMTPDQIAAVKGTHGAVQAAIFVNNPTQGRTGVTPGGTAQPTTTAGTDQTTATTTAPARVGQGQQNFLDSLSGYADQISQQTGIDPRALLSIAGFETGWGSSSNAQQKNNLFSIQGDGSNGSRWADYKSPAESFQAFVDLIQNAPRYATAWADRADPVKFINDLRDAGYIVDEPGYPAQGWVDSLTQLVSSKPVTDAVQAGKSAVGGAQQAVTQGAQAAQQAGQTGLEDLVQASRDAQQRAAGLVQSSQQGLQTAQQGLQAANQAFQAQQQKIDAQNAAYEQERQTSRQNLLNLVNQPSQTLQTAKDLVTSTAQQAQAAAGGVSRQVQQTVAPVVQKVQAVAGPFVSPGPSPVPDLTGNLPTSPTDLLRREQQGLQDIPGALGGWAGGRLQAEAQLNKQVLTDPLISAARTGGINLTPEQERFARVALGTITPTNVLLTALMAPASAARLVQAAVVLTGGALGTAGGGELGGALQPYLPEIRDEQGQPVEYARTIGELAGGFLGPAALERGLAGAARVPGVGGFLRDESGQLTVPGQPPTVGRQTELEPTDFRAPGPRPVQGTRMYHGTASDYPSEAAQASGEQNLYGPGYYLSSDPRVVGGDVGPAQQATVENVQRNLDVQRQQLAQRMSPDYQLPPGARGTREDWIESDRKEVARLEQQLQDVQSPGYVQQPGYAQQRVQNTSKIASDITYWDAMRTQIAERIQRWTDQGATEAQLAPERAKLDVAARKMQDLFEQLRNGPPVGPNVRAVDVPADMNLFDVRKDFSPEELDRVAEAARARYGDEVGDAVRDLHDPEIQVPAHYLDPNAPPDAPWVTDTGMSRQTRNGDSYWHDLTTVLEDQGIRKPMTAANQILADAGYEGIAHEGGRFGGMQDENGRPLQHEVNVIFPHAIGRLTNAVSRTQGGQIEAGLAARLGGAAAGGVAGYQTGNTPEERLRNAAIGAGVGFGGVSAAERLATSPAAREAVGAFGREELGAAGAPEDLARLRDQQTAAPEPEEYDAATENPFSGPIASKLAAVEARAPTKAQVAAAAKTINNLRTVGDRLVGVPAQFTTPEGLANLRNRLELFAREGASQKDWYSDSSRAIKRITQGNLQDAEKLAQLVAIYSPNTPVDTNMNNALAAWYQWKNGADHIEVAMGNQDRRAYDLLFNNKPWEGRKTNNFYRNLMQYIDPAVYKSLATGGRASGVTADVWMMRAFDYLLGPGAKTRWAKSPTRAQYDFIQDEIGRVADKMGWTPEQAQAAIWSSVKAAAEGTGLEEAGFHYGSALERRMAQVSYTASPGSAEIQQVPGYMEAPPHERAAYNDAAEQALKDPRTGRDQIAEAYGILRGSTVEAPEVYGNYVGPGLQAEVPVPAAKASYTERVLSPETGEQLRDAKGNLLNKSIPIKEARGLVAPPARSQLDAYAATKGLILKQDATPWTRVFWNDAPARDSNVVVLHVGRPLTLGEAQALNSEIASTVGEGNHAVVSTADGAWVLNLAGHFERNPEAPPRINVKPYQPVPLEGPTPRGTRMFARELGPFVREEDVRGQWIPDPDKPYAENQKFGDAVTRAVGNVEFEGNPGVSVGVRRGDSNYIGNDWEADPNGEGYRSTVADAGLSRALAELEGPVTARVRAATAAVAKRFGWPPDPHNPFSAAEPADTAAAGLPGAADASQGAAATGGFTAPGGGAAPSNGPAATNPIRSFLSGEGSEAGSINTRAAVTLGGAAAGGLAGYESDRDEGLTGEHVARTLAGAGIGAGIASGLVGYHGNLSSADLRAIRQTGLRGGAVPPGGGYRGPIAHAVDLTKQSILTNPVTHVANVVGNTIELGRQIAGPAMAGRGGDARAALVAAAGGFGHALDNAGAALSGNVRPTLGSEGQVIRGIGSGKVSAASSGVFRALAAADAFTRTLGEYAGMASEANRLLERAGMQASDPGAASYLMSHAAEMTREGAREGRQSVFAQAGSVASARAGLENVFRNFNNWKEGMLSSRSLTDQAMGALADIGIPFSGVPVRLLEIAANRLPGISQGQSAVRMAKALRAGDLATAQREGGRMMMETAIQAKIMQEISNGNIVGPENKEHPGGAVRIGGTWYSLGELGGYALPMEIMASFAEQWKKSGQGTPEGDDWFSTYGPRAAAATGAALQTLAQGAPGFNMIRLLGQIGEGQAGAGALQQAQNAVNRVTVPGAARYLENTFDPTVRDINSRGVDSLWKGPASNWPGLDQFVPPKIDPTTGQPVQNLRTGGLAALIGQQGEVDSPLTKELDRLRGLGGKGLPDPRAYPESVTWRDQTIKLRPDEQRAVAAKIGAARNRLNATVSSPDWDRRSDANKADYLKHQLDEIDNQKLAAWRTQVDPADAERRWQQARQAQNPLKKAS